jgi:hypothetical protein
MLLLIRAKKAGPKPKTKVYRVHIEPDKVVSLGDNLDVYAQSLFAQKTNNVPRMEYLGYQLLDEYEARVLRSERMTFAHRPNSWERSSLTFS